MEFTSDVKHRPLQQIVTNYFFTRSGELLKLDRGRLRYNLLTFIFSNFLSYQENNYLFKVNKLNTRKRCEISSKLTRKVLELSQ